MEISRRILRMSLELIAQDIGKDRVNMNEPVTHEEINEITNELLEACCLTPEHVRPTLTLIQGGRTTPPLPPIPSGDDAA